MKFVERKHFRIERDKRDIFVVVEKQRVNVIKFIQT